MDDLCRKFGVWRTATALFLAAWRNYETRRTLLQLSNRELRDIGLPERQDVLGEQISLVLHMRRFG
ncbi:DUF1127 domain-containing protein [Rhizobium sp. CNPSo 3464]|nr:DUF1127 domain-containing protein [Rhizobium sp. CNPSo 3464]MDK4740268.1 DUF1127 domain-containing protein [Rhizobium sp. CNPSo 3464]